MSAEVLREAAELMRARADYAPASPWVAVVRKEGQAWVDVPDEDGHAWGMHGFPAAAQHVASWHPAVALAVADWLDDLARRHEAAGGERGIAPVDHPFALAVARAYLNTT